jgi:hypothetical protein
LHELARSTVGGASIAYAGPTNRGSQGEPGLEGKDDLLQNIPGLGPVSSLTLQAALSAIRHNPAMEAFRERLLARGKRPKVILTAVARKLLVIANAVIRTGQPWDSQLALTR